MKSVPKLIKKFAGVLIVSIFLLFLLNIVVLVAIGRNQTASGSPYTLADEVGAALVRTGEGYVLPEDCQETLETEHVWAALIDDKTHQVIWNTENLPGEIPRTYSLSDVSDLTLGYVKDYPTYVGDADGGIVVLGWPKDRYWKSMWPTWDYDFIANLPKNILMAFFWNVLAIFLIYLVVTGTMIRSVNPIVRGIRSLPEKGEVMVKETGVFSELAVSINRTSEMLRAQEQLLRRRETARANWIAGVSHDIRTPLSMVMGYAGQLENDGRLPKEDREKAAVIVKQSERMRNLVNDLNLASKLEYNMQPVQREKMNVVSVMRQTVVDFINLDVEGKYPIYWQCEEGVTGCVINADKSLIKRAVGNLIQNSMNHNEGGCNIYVSVQVKNGRAGDEWAAITVADDGTGASDEEIERLNRKPHYMMCDENTSEQRHGLGLLIVKQVAAVHGGRADIRQSSNGGFEVEISFPAAGEINQ